MSDITYALNFNINIVKIYFFSVKPVCAEEQTMVIGVALREIASVNCTVNANPVDRLKFLWTFNSSSELNYLPDSRFTQDGKTSQVNKKHYNNSLTAHISRCWK